MVTHDGDYVAYEDANIDENQEPIMSDVHDSSVIGRTREIYINPVGSL